MHFSKSSLAALAAMLSTAHAHMIMKTPTPYGKSTLNNSPLAADGSDFPCKQRSGVYDAEGASNTMPIGSVQTLSFTGSAVHGGGSCQVSLTTDKQPSKSTKWQVIHSIEGGCPAKAQDGNLAEGTNDSDTYQFTIPAGIAPGEYTLAWTWFNRIGNREMYMNCAPVTVTGGSARKRAIAARKEATLGFTKRASFPAMFLANIGNGCTTADSKDLIFPDPGTSLEKDGVPANLAPPVGSCAGGSGGSGGASSSAAPAAASSPAPSSAVAAAPAVSSPAAAAPSAASSPAAAAPSAASSPSSVIATPASAPSSTPLASSGGNSAAGTLSGACSNEGAWNCLAGTSFQRCASGSWSVAQPMPAGTHCTPGQSENLDMLTG